MSCWRSYSNLFLAAYQPSPEEALQLYLKRQELSNSSPVTIAKQNPYRATLPNLLPVDDYEAHRERVYAHDRAISLSGRDIGPIPQVKNPERKVQARESFRAFCDSYFPQVFFLGWSPDHLKILQKIEIAVLKGGLFALAMPRGSGKSSLCEVACLWAVLYGHRQFVCLIGSDEGHSQKMLDSIKREIETNPLLEADFPEAVYPILKLEGIHNRASGQLCQGLRTRISWTDRQIILPAIPESPAAGAIVRTAGILGGLRGMSHKRPDGSSVRPSLVVVDDPQTDQSARSPTQCAFRENVLAGAVLGLAGPGQAISGILPCTVIAPGDLADSILDQKKHPEWHGERTKLVYSWPSNEKLWAEYAELRQASFRSGHRGEEATAFYQSHQQEMDEGAKVAWSDRKRPDELSAIQHAMNLKIDLGEVAFSAEYQNEPVTQLPGEDLLTPDDITARINHRPQGEVPLAAAHLTAFVDVQEKLLFWLVAAWSSDFTGWIVDYDAWPKQNQKDFTLRNAHPTISQMTKIGSREGSIHAGLTQLAAELLTRDFHREDGTPLRIEKCLVDSGWGETSELVKTFCKQSPHAGLLLASRGHYIGASSRPFSDYTRHPGDRIGLHWRIPAASGRMVRVMTIDTNFWKSFVQSRLVAPMGEKGALTLFGDNPERHQLLARHLTAEYPVRVEAKGRQVDEWKIRPERPDNHWLDCLVGAAAAASMLGAALWDQARKPKQRQRVDWAQMQKQARQR